MIYKLKFYYFDVHGRLIRSETYDFCVRPLELRAYQERDEVRNVIMKGKKFKNAAAHDPHLQERFEQWVTNICMWYFDKRKDRRFDHMERRINSEDALMDPWSMFPEKFEAEDEKRLKRLALLRGV